MGKPWLVAQPIVRARARHVLGPSRISAPVVQFGRILLPFYLRFALQFRKIEFFHPETILDELDDFQAQRTRLIVAFRHAYGDEPQLVFHIFSNLLPRLAKRLKRPLRRQSLIRIIHDYAVPLWGDAVIRFLLPRAGAVPIYHVKFDPASLKQIRRIMTDDPCPLALAPEGQISYHSETLPRIEKGTIRMGFWCAKDIEKAGRSENVRILPLSIHYQYDPRDLKKVFAAVSQLENTCGLDVRRHKPKSLELADLLPRIIQIENQVLTLSEAFYSKTYSYQPPAVESTAKRWDALLAAALAVAESALGLSANGAEVIQRVYRIRQEGWDRIYPVTPIDHLNPLESAFADRQAGEAWFAMRHMELVDLMSYHDPDYLLGRSGDKISFDCVVETVVTLQDLVGRLLGGNISTRPNAIRKHAVLVTAPCLDLTDLLPAYHQDARTTVQNATDELSRKYEESIKEYLHEQK